MSTRGASAASASPMIAQYRALKAEHPGCLLFFRLGDFYELFFDDAKLAAPALDIALTRRGRHGGDDIPMCGVPVHSAESYLERLIRKGFKVAICEQTEAPEAARRRAGKTLVERDVVRVVTPGTLTEDSLLDARRHNFLAALARRGADYALAWLEMSTGEFRTTPIAEAALATELARLDPGELLLPEGLLEVPELMPLWREWRDRSSPLVDREFDSLAGERRLERTFRVAVLDGFGTFSRAELGACGALIGYLELTQKGQLPHLSPPRQMTPGSHLVIDAATRRNLELLSSLSGTRQGSLLAAIDRTVTGAGARLMAARLAAPLAQVEPIRRRLDAVEALVDDARLRTDLRGALRGCPDLERALSRLSLGRGGPRDLAAIRSGLQAAVGIKAHLADSGTSLAVSASSIVAHGALIGQLEAALVDEPPVLARDGGLIRPGHDGELDRLRGLRDQARRHVAELEARLQRETGIGSLKIRHNNMLGYFVEVTATHLAKVPEHFAQRQSMANATRYRTTELADLESQIANAGERAEALELELFEALRALVLAGAEPIARTARVLARLDVAAGLAELAVEQRYQRPEIDEGDAFSIVGGRHPVVEQALAAEAQPFVPNDADLSAAQRLWLLTGPNMAGKSTFLRQNALIAILAQSGSFVPVESARIGVVDRVFSRVGAADDLARGRSTFMVEMVETAAILNQATPRSLVILDEIGRGTATYDGLSIAWAVVEHLHEVNRCRALFATHYHELTALASKLDHLACRTMQVKEWQNEVIFLHEVAEGAADRSYGIHVARLAGLPTAVLERAEAVLRELEQGEAKGAPARLAEDLPLFAAVANRPAATATPPTPSPTSPDPSPIEAVLAALQPDDLTPKEALDLLYDLKRRFDERK